MATKKKGRTSILTSDIPNSKRSGYAKALLETIEDTANKFDIQPIKSYRVKHTPIFEPNPVTAPPHYTDGGIETIDYLRAKLTPDEFKGFCKGNALKYISRAGKKSTDELEDYRKAKWYIDKLIETI